MAHSTLSRRRFLCGSLVAAPLAVSGGAAVARDYQGAGIPWKPEEALPPDAALISSHQFLTPAERQFLTAAVDRLIPADEEWPGASQLGVVNFLDDQLAGSYGRGERWYMQGPWPKGESTQGFQSRLPPAGLYRKAIAAIDQHCQKTFGGRAFSALAEDDQDKVLTGLEKGEIELDGVSASTFFDLLHQNTLEGFFGDPVHGGNKDMTAWKMIGFPGARYDYRPFVSRHNERLDLEPVSVAGMTTASIRRTREGS